ncbi:hypothetical protein BH11MYX2_BH11MYX2_17400 [soil metagenome]
MVCVGKIVGGGPSGLQAALSLGRARKRVLLCDSGPRRNAAATHIYNFVTRDATPPEEFRRMAREQLATYPNVEVQDRRVKSITGRRGAFHVTVDGRVVEARRIRLGTGMVDERSAIDGFAEHWGHSIVQCPYCHGWEQRDQKWGFLVMPPSASHFLAFALQLRGWTKDVAVFTNSGFDIADADREQLRAAGVRVETAKVVRIEGADGAIQRVALDGGTHLPIDLLFAHPPQQQVPLVQELGLALEDGLVKVDPMMRVTSVPGIYASGDLTTRMQGAVIAAASGAHTASMLNMELTVELALAGTI